MGTEIKVNFAKLEEITDTMETYYNAILTIEKQINNINVILNRNKSETIAVFLEDQIEFSTELNSCKEELKDLITIMESYTEDMQSYIKQEGIPSSCTSLLRVDQKDIFNNLNSIDSAYNGLANLITYKLPYSFPVDPTQEESIKNMQDNYQTITRIQTTYFTDYCNKIKNELTGLWDIYNNKVKKFEETEESYYEKAVALYDKYTSLGERIFGNLGSFFTEVGGFFEGVVASLWELVTGIVKLVWGIVKLAGAGIVYCFTKPFDAVPDWAESTLNETGETFSTIGETLKMIAYDPELVCEMIGQSFTDVVEEKGVGYVTGYALTEVVTTIGTGGLAKAGKATKLEVLVKFADKLSDLQKTSKLKLLLNACNVIDDTSDTGRKLQRLESLFSSLGEEKFQKLVTKLDDVAELGRVKRYALMSSIELYLQDVISSSVVKNIANHVDDILGNFSSLFGNRFAYAYAEQEGSFTYHFIEELSSKLMLTKGQPGASTEKYIDSILKLTYKAVSEHLGKTTCWSDFYATYKSVYNRDIIAGAYYKYTGQIDHLDDINFGKLLTDAGYKKLSWIQRIHAHHICYKRGRPGEIARIAKEGRDILIKYGIDPVLDVRNLVWAPNKGHSVENIMEVLEELKKGEQKGLEKCASKGITDSKLIQQEVQLELEEKLDQLGKIAQSR